MVKGGGARVMALDWARVPRLPISGSVAVHEV